MLKTTRFKWSLLLLSGFLLVFGVACSTSSNNTPTPSLPTDEVSVQLSWVHTIEFAGFYVAQNQDFYAQNQLQVELLTPNLDDPNFNPVTEVLAGQAQFGIVSGGELVTARAEGAPVVAIASIYQRNPLAFISLAEKDIYRPQDLIGHRVQYSPASSEVMYEAMMTTQRVDRALVQEEPRTSYNAISALLNDEVDVIDAWITNEVVDLELAGQNINMILPSDYGVVMYPNVIFTTEAMLDSEPELVRRFVEATLQGLTVAAENPDDATELALTYNEALNPEKEDWAMDRSLALIRPGGEAPGQMTDLVWQQTYNILLEQDLLANPFPIEDVYTLQFLQSTN